VTPTERAELKTVVGAQTVLIEAIPLAAEIGKLIEGATTSAQLKDIRSVVEEICGAFQAQARCLLSKSLKVMQDELRAEGKAMNL